MLCYAESSTLHSTTYKMGLAVTPGDQNYNGKYNVHQCFAVTTVSILTWLMRHIHVFINKLSILPSVI